MEKRMELLPGVTLTAVQTPTLAMLADRDSKIVLFRKEKYHYVQLALEGAEAVSDRIVSPESSFGA